MPSFLAEQLAQNTGRSLLRSSGKGGSVSSTQSPPQTEFYSVLFLVPKKNRQMRPVINLKALNRWVDGNPPHQNRRPDLSSVTYLDLSPGPAEAGRLVDKGGLEGCLPYGTNTPRPPALSPLHHRGSGLPVHLPSLWVSMRPMGLHQGNEGSGDFTQVVVGDQDIIIYINDILIMSESTALTVQCLEIQLTSYSAWGSSSTPRSQ